jgi:peptide/nickel transport system permease protein
LKYLLGTDSNGRDLLAVIIVGTGLTLRIGFLAGAIGLGIAIALGFLSGYYGGFLDTIIRGVVDVLLTIPALAVLVVIAAMISGVITLNLMIIIVASLSWMLPTRTIRAQVLTMREKAYIPMAKISGMKNLEIIIKELIPNLLPYLAAGFVGATSAAVLATIGLEALGLGPQSLPTLGMTIFWAVSFSAMLRGMWWWWLPPVIIIAALFVGLFLLTAGLDEIANPKLRRVV